MTSCRSSVGRRVSEAARVTALVFLALTLVACFEEPVEERLHLTFASDGTCQVKVVTTITNLEDGDGNRSLARRLAETRRDYEHGLDPWSARFSLLEPDHDRLTWERDEGVLVRVERSATASDHEALRRFLADASLAAFVRVQARQMELEIVPAGGGRASRSQRNRVEELLESWSGAVARTLAAVERLYAYLKRAPEAARPCLAGLFHETLESSERGERDLMTEEGRRLVDAVTEARQEVLSVFEVPGDEAYSLNELSHLVFDPFPSRLAVSVPGEPREVEGFERDADGSLFVSGLGLYEALQMLAGAWVAPDPIVAYVETLRSGGGKHLSLAELADTPRLAIAPGSREVRQALEDRLRPAPLYRVVWTVGGAVEQ